MDRSGNALTREDAASCLQQMIQRMRTFPFHLFVLYFLASSCAPVFPIENPFASSSEESPSNDILENSGELRIFILDVGQGDATIVLGPGPDGKTLLIDAGPPGRGVATVLPTLESLRLTSLHWIVATHYDADHLGGIREVLAGPDQENETEDDFLPDFDLLDRGDATDKTTPTYLDYIDAAALFRREAVPGMRINLGGNAFAEVIVVNGNFSDGRAIHLNPDEENESSIGLLIQYGDFRYFTAGDLTGGGSPGGYESKDLETTAGEIIGDIDILHVGHHGSETSTNETFLSEVSPEAAVISVGQFNDYGHPAESVLNRLLDAGVEIYRTDQAGALEIRSDGAGFTVNSR